MERLLRTMEPIRWVFWALLVTAADAGPAVVVVIFAVVGFGYFFEMFYLAIFRMLRDSETLGVGFGFLDVWTFCTLLMIFISAYFVTVCVAFFCYLNYSYF